MIWGGRERRAHRDRASLTAATWQPPEAQRAVTLDEAIGAADPQARLLVPFDATWRGRSVLVTAVLERTAVAHPAGAAGDPDERMLVRRTELLVEAGWLRWRLARRTPEGEGLVLHVKQRVRRCSECRRTADETQFRAYKAAYCVQCSRRRQAVIDRRRRQSVAA